ncbi:MAG: S8 family serine peptidase [Candidatus Sericytochromatia bacterium]|nr:S8 family serine peptidase [Candidatus Sericytochromatia bacterium]
MTIHRHQHLRLGVIALMLSACSAPMPALVSQPFQIQSQEPAEAVTSVIVQLKAGRVLSMAMPAGRAMLLPKTRVYPLNGEPLQVVLDRLRQDGAVAFAEPNSRVHALATVNDSQYGQLWGFAKAQVPAAWDKTTGRADVLVAVIDSGVDDTHPDLKNGQIVRGPDLVENDNVPQDEFGHGTHVAGTIAATANNSLGVAGMAYGCKVLAVRVLGKDGSGSLADVADGIIKAQQLGAKVINLSLGGTESEQVLEQAVDKVSAAGTLVVAAAGNSNTTQPSYPAGYKSVLAVGATDQKDQRASFSNYGANTTIAAPGVSILSTSAGVYKSMSGTSMASPHVAAAAALLFSLKPSATAAEVRQALVSSGDPVTGFGGTVKRLNLVRAMAALEGTPMPAPTRSATPVPAPTASATPVPVPTATATPRPVPTASTTPTPGAGTLPAPFVALSTSGLARDRVTVNWTTTTPTYGYVEWAGNGTSGRSPWSPSTVQHSYTITGMRPATKYNCRAIAYMGSQGMVTSPTMTVTTLP